MAPEAMKSIRMSFEGQLSGLVGDADHSLLNAELIHLVQCHGDRIMRSQLLGHLFEHVLDRKLEVLFGLAVLGLPVE